jgi:hypothetical protein
MEWDFTLARSCFIVKNFFGRLQVFWERHSGQKYKCEKELGL